MDDDEEELRHEPRSVGTRTRTALTVVAVAALVAAGVVWLTTRGDDQPAARRAAPSSSAGTTVVPVPSTSPPPCSGSTVCEVSETVPAAVRAALRDRYRGARVATVRTLTTLPASGTGQLVRRTIAASAGERRFDITVTPFVLGPDDLNRYIDGNRSIVQVKSTGSGKTVDLQLIEPRSTRADDLTVLRLARDPRLTVLR